MDTKITENSGGITGLIERIRKYTLAAVKEPRYEHSVRVAETAARLCRKYGLDEQSGYLAGISHDMCKDMSDAMLTSLAGRDGKPITLLEQKKTALLHGRAAAVKLREDFGVSDPDVLEAVADHTFGEAGMSSLAKVIYVADKIEPGREYATNEYLSRLDKLSLDDLLYTVLTDSIVYLNKKGHQVAPASERLLESLKK
jgi:predicted HD superfamily hydrolase involved in NAD metabolism